ncbi:hypothetical protein ACO0QE_002202 [Hanseniaspora vineae]
MSAKRALSTAASVSPTSAIKTGLILSRTPIITKTPTKLESIYYEYQSELEKRLTWTFPHWYYFKKGTLAEKAYTKLQKKPIFRVPDVFYPRGTPDLKHGRERSEKQVIVLPEDVAETSSDQEGAESAMLKKIVPNSRVTEADQKKDMQSLERALEEHLYLLVKNSSKKSWEFPTFDMSNGSLLHNRAEAGLKEIGGPHIHTWTVSNTPCKVLQDGQANTFFIKSHILAGKFEPKDLEFAWVTKKEFKGKVSESYYTQMSHLLN